MNVPLAVRTAVLARAGDRCERCGHTLKDPWRGYSLQHRRARGMGGSRRADTNSAVNLGALCGSATTPDGCHHWVESHPVEAAAEGWRVAQHEDPAAVPVLLHGVSLVLLTTDYGYQEAA